jgi:hypothetical protein
MPDTSGSGVDETTAAITAALDEVLGPGPQATVEASSAVVLVDDGREEELWRVFLVAIAPG